MPHILFVASVISEAAAKKKTNNPIIPNGTFIFELLAFFLILLGMIAVYLVLVESAKKTSRAMVVDEGYARYGVTGEIASVIAEGAFYNLEAPVKRMGAMHVPIPFSPPLEDATVPTEQTVFEVARALCGKT